MRVPGPGDAAEAEARGRFAAAPVARLATVTPAGGPHVVPVVFALHRDVLWSAVDGKPKTSANLRRVANIRSNPLVSLLVDHYDADWSALWWVRADGRAEVMTAETAEGQRGITQLVAKYEQYQSDPPLGPVIVVRVERWTHWSWSGPFPRRSP
ncbi:TIGR03668 family PPOX class F420-dependent oxidoreductase [Pedococcus sp.]|uniref:TIGR03668 family PPOX class F420-dependent oxidoreductase n=1 Tax=Pedococcus sp. TaxID=2860345 RepID=UPI002E0D2AFD|nr:TIGR03668 family PPOX class F420-dependent oxidoreductase [Pedococcus sp.]